MTDDVLARQLLDDYNAYRAQTRRFFEMRETMPWIAKGLKPTPKNLKLLMELIAWCRERHHEPRAWLYGLFRIRNWVFAPQFKAGHLMSDKVAAKIRKGAPSRFLQERLRASETGVADIDPEIDVIDTVEQRKEALASRGMHARCAETLDETLGYHPKSKACARCPAAGDCAIALAARFDYDIIGARARGTRASS